MCAALALLTACNSDDDIMPAYTVGEDYNVITLRAGLSGNDDEVGTRAKDDKHSQHVPFTSGTKLRLRVDGTWTGKPDVSQTTIATVGAETATDSKHNKITSYSPVLYWDDYGTADPANMEVGGGRKKGLTIYGAAVSDEKAEAPTITSWTAQEWELPIDQTTTGWKHKDLLTSNNIRKDDDGTLKFDDIYDNNAATDPSDTLEFTHAMSGISVTLTAGVGYPDGKFQTAPKVTMLDFNYKGNVSIEAKTSTATAANEIKLYRDNGATWAKANESTFTGLFFPGNTFTYDKDILKIEADGNTLYVTAEKINDAMNTKYGNTEFRQGYNYIFKVTINKTDIDVEATIINWISVEAESVAPKIDIDDSYGDTGTNFVKNFDFFLSENKVGSYLTSGNHSAVTYDAGTYTMTTPLYWENHSVHYFFRGTWPVLGTIGQTDINEEYIPDGKLHDATGATVIDIKNVAYTPDTYPSDLMLALPHAASGCTDHENEECKAHHKNIDTYGICATEGKIRMNFNYMMSQVEVDLATVEGVASVNIGADTKVEIINVANTGYVKFEDREIVPAEQSDSYELNAVSTSGLSGDELTVAQRKRHSAIVPQVLTYTSAGASTNLRFMITVTNNDAVYYTDEDAEVIAGDKQAGDVKTAATTDIYYADVAPILKSDKSGKVAPEGKWESGVHYKYTLTLKKTEINVTATIKDWIPVEASDEVWF